MSRSKANLSRARHRALIQHADRVSVSGRVDRARLCRGAALTVAAERAAELAVVVFVDALADQQGAVAAVAMLNRAGDFTKAAAQECELEFRHISDGALHETRFGREERIPARHRRLRSSTASECGEELMKNCVNPIRTVLTVGLSSWDVPSRRVMSTAQRR